MSLDLVAQEDPPAAELVAGDHAAAGELERCGQRQVEERGDLAGIEQSNGYEPGPITAQPWGRTIVVRDPDVRRVEVK